MYVTKSSWKKQEDGQKDNLSVRLAFLPLIFCTTDIDSYAQTCPKFHFTRESQYHSSTGRAPHPSYRGCWFSSQPRKSSFFPLSFCLCYYFYTSLLKGRVNFPYALVGFIVCWLHLIVPNNRPLGSPDYVQMSFPCSRRLSSRKWQYSSL